MQAGQTITIDNGASHDVAGNGAAPSGTTSDPAALLPAHGNSVIMNNGTVTGYVYGGWSSVNGGTATTTGNSVIISGGSVGGTSTAGIAA